MAMHGYSKCKLYRLGVDSIPECGTNQEVLDIHGLDYGSLIKAILNILNKKLKS
jgi:hypothetical protein